MLMTPHSFAITVPNTPISDDISTDLNTLSELIFAIAPSARIVPEGGINVFYLFEKWAFALVPHKKNVSLYHASDLDISRFYERLKNVHLGDHCLLIDNLDQVNLNVLVELLALLKVDMVKKYQLDQALH